MPPQIVQRQRGVTSAREPLVRRLQHLLFCSTNDTDNLFSGGVDRTHNTRLNLRRATLLADDVLHPDLGVARERSMRERLRDIRLSGDAGSRTCTLMQLQRLLRVYGVTEFFSAAIEHLLTCCVDGGSDRSEHTSASISSAASSGPLFPFCRGSKHSIKPPRKARRISNFALPYDHDAPAVFDQRVQISLVTADVLRELRVPEFDSRSWCVGKPATSMAMPKAAMHENDGSPAGKDDVGPSGKAATMESKA